MAQLIDPSLDAEAASEALAQRFEALVALVAVITQELSELSSQSSGFQLAVGEIVGDAEVEFATAIQISIEELASVRDSLISLQDQLSDIFSMKVAELKPAIEDRFNIFDDEVIQLQFTLAQTTDRMTELVAALSRLISEVGLAFSEAVKLLTGALEQTRDLVDAAANELTEKVQSLRDVLSALEEALGISQQTLLTDLRELLFAPLAVAVDQLKQSIVESAGQYVAARIDDLGAQADVMIEQRLQAAIQQATQALKEIISEQIKETVSRRDRTAAERQALEPVFRQLEEMIESVYALTEQVEQIQNML